MRASARPALMFPLWKGNRGRGAYGQVCATRTNMRKASGTHKEILFNKFHEAMMGLLMVGVLMRECLSFHACST